MGCVQGHGAGVGRFLSGPEGSTESSDVRVQVGEGIGCTMVGVGRVGGPGGGSGGGVWRLTGSLCLLIPGCTDDWDPE